MASTKILQRAQTAMEIAEDYLLADDEDDAEDADTVSRSESGDVEEETTERSEHEEPQREQKDDEGRENSSDIDAKNKDAAREKKSEKNMGQKLKSLMGVALRPFGSKLQWKLDFNFEASNRAAKSKTGNRHGQTQSNSAEDGKKPAGSANNDGRKTSTVDGAEIERLRMENRRLEKLADKFLDAYIKLKTRIGELSEVEGQLMAAKDSCKQLKEELQQLRIMHERSTTELSTSSDAHRAEVGRLETELKNASKDLAKLEQDKKSLQDSNKEYLKSSQSMKKDLDAVSAMRTRLETELTKQKELHNSETSQLREKIGKAEKDLQESIGKNRDIIVALKQAATDIENRAKQTETENVRLQRQLADAGKENATLQATLGCSTVKINELRRVIAVLESNPSTSTAVDASGRGNFSCPLCGQQFGTLANMQLHAEDCGS